MVDQALLDTINQLQVELAVLRQQQEDQRHLANAQQEKIARLEGRSALLVMAPPSCPPHQPEAAAGQTGGGNCGRGGGYCRFAHREGPGPDKC